MKKILSVGSCGHDNSQIRSVVDDTEIQYKTANTAADGQMMLSQENFDLVLVNRIIDYDGSSGIDFILKNKTAQTPFMLISNFAEAQKAAIDSGAEPGFGKSELHNPQVKEKILTAVKLEAST